MTENMTGKQALMPAAVYVRRSCARSSDTSCDDQKANCINAMQKLGYYLKCEEALYEDDIQSGVQFFNRPRMADIITLLKSTKPLNPKPYEAIFVDDVSRIARNIAFGAMFVQALRFHKIKLFDARGSEFTSTVGYTSFLLLSVCAETERVWVSERTSRGMRAAAQRKILSGKVYGFKRAGTKIES